MGVARGGVCALPHLSRPGSAVERQMHDAVVEPAGCDEACEVESRVHPDLVQDVEVIERRLASGVYRREGEDRLWFVPVPARARRSLSG